ncbi:MAG: hypothetical protein WCQ16_02865 [Verrucomicrobiae bacterium]
MSPIDRVRRLYGRFRQPRTFDEDLAAHLQNGVVASTPTHFLMARAIVRGAPGADDPWVRFDNPDTWLIWAAAGPCAESVKTFCLTVQPFPLRWVAWARRNGPLIYHTINNESTFRSSHQPAS